MHNSIRRRGTIMLLRPEDEHGAASDRREARESRWLDDIPMLHLLGHVMFTLLLLALAFTGVALFIWSAT